MASIKLADNTSQTPELLYLSPEPTSVDNENRLDCSNITGPVPSIEDPPRITEELPIDPSSSSSGYKIHDEPVEDINTVTDDSGVPFIEDCIFKIFDILFELGPSRDIFHVTRKKPVEQLVMVLYRNASKDLQSISKIHKMLHMLYHLQDNPNVAKISQVIQSDHNIYIFYEYIETDLFSMIRHNLCEEIHNHIVHRDITPVHILVDSQCGIHLSHFNNAAFHRANSHHRNPDPVITTYIADRWYRAPEILLGQSYCTRSVDIWAVGCIIIEILSKKPLFGGLTTIEVLSSIINLLGSPSPVDIRAIESPYKNALLKLIHITQPTSLLHRYPNIDPNALDLVSKCLTFNPQTRITASQALKHSYLATFHNPDDEITRTSIPFAPTFKSADQYSKEIAILCDKKGFKKKKKGSSSKNKRKD